MTQIVKQVLVAWNIEKNQRLKMQKAYFFAAFVLAVIAGLVTLVSPYIGMNIIMVAAVFAVVYLVNAISWTVLDLIVSKKIAGIVKVNGTTKKS